LSFLVKKIEKKIKKIFEQQQIFQEKLESRIFFKEKN